MPSNMRAACLVALATLAAGACGGPPSTATSIDPAVLRDQAALASLQPRRQEREQALRSMAVPQLAQELTADSKRGVEPFNSPAYREAIARGQDAAADLRTAMAPDAGSLLALLALRQISRQQYQNVDAAVRMRILVEALRQARFFNTFGIPHLFWEDAAKAAIEEGPALAEPLIALLDDRRDAPVWGSEGAAEQRRYGYRVCDYAWALLNEIRGQRVTIPLLPADRDRLIAESRTRG